MSTAAIKTAVISQPHCCPWMGYMKLIAMSDVFVILDNVQFEKRSWQNRNRIKGPNGPVFLTVPVVTRGRYEQKISEVEIDNTQPWGKKHLKTIELNYRRAPHYDAIMNEIGPLLEKQWGFLMEFTISVIRTLSGLLRFEPDFHFASNIAAPGGKNEYLINICKQFDATRYISNDGSAAYLDDALFSAAAVKLEFLNYKHPEYEQLFGEFVPYMSCLDVLMNTGPERARELVLTG